MIQKFNYDSVKGDVAWGLVKHRINNKGRNLRYRFLNAIGAVWQ